MGKVLAAKLFGEILKEAREAKGHSQEELAKKAQIDRTFVSFLERGLRQPTLTTLVSLATALKTRASRLIAKFEYRLSRR